MRGGYGLRMRRPQAAFVSSTVQWEQMGSSNMLAKRQD